MLGGLFGGPMLYFMPTPSPGRPSNSSSLEICRALLCNRSYSRDNSAQALRTLDARVFIPPRYPPRHRMSDDSANRLPV